MLLALINERWLTETPSSIYDTFQPAVEVQAASFPPVYNDTKILADATGGYSPDC